MRTAFSNLAWPAADDASAMQLLVDAEVTALEVAPTRLWDDPLAQDADEVAAARRAIEDSGMRVVALQSLLFGKPELQLFGSAEAREGLHAHLVGMADLAVGLGATRLVFGSPGNRRRGDLPVEDADGIGGEFFARLGREAAERGVCFVMEANPSDYGCDWLSDSVASTAFVRAVDSPGVRLHLDTACMALAGDDAPRRVREGADVLAHVHASAPQLGEVGPDGPVDHSAIASALREVRYEGHVSVEMLAQTGDVLGAVARATKHLKEIYG